MEGELTFCIGSLHSETELFMPNSEAELEGNEETGRGGGWTRPSKQGTV